MRAIHVRIHLFCCYARMAQELLDHTQVGTTLYQMRGKAVPKRVRMQPIDSGIPSVLLANGVHGLPGKPATPLV